MLSLRGWHVLCHEMRDSTRKVRKQKNFPLYAPQRLHKAVVTQNCAILSKSGVHPQAMHQAFPLTCPSHSLLSCSILPACLKSKAFF